MSGMTGSNKPGSGVLKTGALASTTATPNQVILTYTVSSLKQFILYFIEINALLTTFAATATFFGTASIQINGVTVHTFNLAGAGIAQYPVEWFTDEGIPLPAGTVISIVCTPSAVTPFTWEANLVGVEV